MFANCPFTNILTLEYFPMYGIHEYQKEYLHSKRLSIKFQINFVIKICFVNITRQ